MCDRTDPFKEAQLCPWFFSLGQLSKGDFQLHYEMPMNIAFLGGLCFIADLADQGACICSAH